MTDQLPTVVLTRPILEPAMTLLREAADVRVLANPLPGGLLTAVHGVVGIVCQLVDAIDDSVLSTPGLRVVSNVAAGYDNIDVEAATRRGVMVTNTPRVVDETTADFAIALMLAAARRVVNGDQLVRSGAFRGWAIDTLLGQDMYQATLGIIGFGKIGRAVARRAKAFDMRVIYTARHEANAGDRATSTAECVPLAELLETSDFVSIHVPLTEATHHLLSTAEFRRMKRTAVLVNTSRGQVVDEDALVNALYAGEIFAAGLDVYEHEPRVHPGLTELANVVLAPHAASASLTTRSAMSVLAARNVLAVIRGEAPPNLVNARAVNRG